MFSADPMSEIKFRFVFAWHKKPEKSWLELLDYGKENYLKRFGEKPNIGFVHPETFVEEFWLSETLMIFKSKYCTKNLIFLGELEDVLFQNLFQQLQQTRETDEPIQL